MKNRLRAVEHWIWIHRVTLLALVCVFVLLPLICLGRVEAGVGISGIMALFYFIDSRGKDRQHDRLSEVIGSLRGGGNAYEPYGAPQYGGAGGYAGQQQGSTADRLRKIFGADGKGQPGAGCSS